jgi:hypothetical protein
MKVYCSCKACFMREFINGCDVNDLSIMDGESKIESVKRIEEKINLFQESWIESPHHSSKLVALFMKIMASFLWCKQGISQCNYWIVEKESCDWLPYWNYFGKRDYLRIQCEFMETVYDDSKMSAFDQEIMRINSLWVLSDNRQGMAPDNVNEMYIFYLKMPQPIANFDTACDRSAHTMATCCGQYMLWGPPKMDKSGASCSTSTEKDVLSIQVVLHTAGIFANHTAMVMDDTPFLAIGEETHWRWF